jgi:hypothetical protein
MRALGWISIAVGPLAVVRACPVAIAQRRSRSQLALIKVRAGTHLAGFERQP